MVYYFYMKEINGNTLIVIRRKCIKRLRSGKVIEHCHDLKIKTAGRKNKSSLVQEITYRKCPSISVATDDVLSDLLRSLYEPVAQ